MNSSQGARSVFAALNRLAEIQREPLDRLALQDVTERAQVADDYRQIVNHVSQSLRLDQPDWSPTPDLSRMPALIVQKAEGNADQLGILRGQNGNGWWLVEWFDAVKDTWTESVVEALSNSSIASIRLRPAFRPTHSAVFQLLVHEIWLKKSLLVESLIGGLLITFLGMLMSFYSLQVYDRVIPTGAHQTLLVLSGGMVLVLLLELMSRQLRSRVTERLIEHLDKQLSQAVYKRFLAVRIDQMPQGVGTLASQLRGYETVRSYMMGLTGYVTVDLPFAFLLLGVVAMIEPALTLVPLIAALLAAGVAVFQVSRIQALSTKNHDVVNRKTGLLVESIEGAEVIKSSQGGWRMLNRWTASADESRDLDLQIKRYLDFSAHWGIFVQQAAFASLLALGALMVTEGQLSMGALLACTILGGRVINPFVALSQQLVGWSQARAALRGLDAIWSLESEGSSTAASVRVDQIKGNYLLKNVQMCLGGKPALCVDQLEISAGARLGILGPVGAGKSTLMKLLAGLYKPGEGEVLLDGIDLSLLSRQSIAEHVGYLPQDGRLLAGTLRENLTLGQIDPGDEVLINTARLTGLYDSVIAPHSHGLQQLILEGGMGLSGGQRQLVNLTRVFLRRPGVWLLDEPTSNLDRHTEAQVIRALLARLRPTDTLILITHKTELLHLVDRLLVVGNQRVVLSGCKSDVLAGLTRQQAEQEYEHV